jgi:N-acetylmuramoyl-L-alanine amidase
MLLPSLPALARHTEAWARERFAVAERMREALESKPAGERTRHDFQRVLDAYRSVYYGTPTSTKADASAVSAAELLVEMGRQFDDEKLLRSAIKQFEFLRHEYPASKYRFDALLTIGQIYKDDLDEPDQARASFEEFLKRYPHHRLAEDAQTAMAELDQKASAKEAALKTKETKSSKTDDSETPASVGKSGKLAHVTGVRYWSTPDCTRVAIDLEQNVKFDAQRLSRPKRIFFDLSGTRLAWTLVGKSFDVEDGLLKRIRIAQFKPDKTRVVLEVDDVSDYTAFLQPNPTRLIIEIRNKKLARTLAKKERVKIADDRPDPGSEVDSGAAALSPAAEKEIVTSSKPDTKVEGKIEKAALYPGTVPTRIVEADDDDVPQKADAQPSPSKKTPESLDSRPAGKRHAKRKAVDGNNDEVATLDPADFPVESKPLSEAASTLYSTATRVKSKSKKKPEAAELAREAQPTAAGDRSLIRALGLKIGRIVIDPGHGGHDTGTIGPNGVEEKNLVLDVSKRLGKLLQARMGAEVVFTRQDDTFVPLETRTAIANQEQADLFVSIHANSSSDPDARGVETYYLNFTTNADALEVAARENAASDKSIHELQDLVKKIALKEKIEESREFASDVQRSLHSGLAVKSPAIRDRGVKKAPFVVLIGANMPSILAEISFVSNPADARKLKTAEYRQRIAESLYKGISNYVSGLSGVKVASRMGKSEGQ